MLCGLLCAGSGFNPAVWLNHAMGYDEILTIADLGRGHALAQLLEETLDGFEAEDFSLFLLLPGDDSPLAERAAALGSWCRGFLSGFGVAGVVDDAALSDDGRGFLRDLREIGNVDVELADGGNDEFSLMELCEYTRMGALLLREERRFAETDDMNDESLH